MRGLYGKRKINIELAKWHTEKLSKAYPPDIFEMVGSALVHRVFDSGRDNFIKSYTDSLDTMRLILVLLSKIEQDAIWVKIEEHEDTCFKGDYLMVSAEMIAEAAANVLGLSCETTTQQNAAPRPKRGG